MPLLPALLMSLNHLSNLKSLKPKGVGIFTIPSLAHPSFPQSNPTTSYNLPHHFCNLYLLPNQWQETPNWFPRVYFPLLAVPIML